MEIFSIGRIIASTAHEIEQKDLRLDQRTGLETDSEYANIYYKKNEHLLAQLKEEIQFIYKLMECEMQFQREFGDKLRELKIILVLIRK